MSNTESSQDVVHTMDGEGVESLSLIAFGDKLKGPEGQEVVWCI